MAKSQIHRQNDTEPKLQYATCIKYGENGFQIGFTEAECEEIHNPEEEEQE